MAKVRGESALLHGASTTLTPWRHLHALQDDESARALLPQGATPRQQERIVVHMIEQRPEDLVAEALRREGGASGSLRWGAGQVDLLCVVGHEGAHAPIGYGKPDFYR
jgi:hypothetical protein